MPPARPPGPPKPDGRVIRFQPNPTFHDRPEMEEWVRQNIPDGKIVRTWEVTMLACEVETKSKAAAVTKRKKRQNI